MWEIRVVSVGKPKEPAARAWTDQLAVRVGGEWRLRLDSVDGSKKAEPAARRREETAALLARAPGGAEVVALDPKGEAMDTMKFSNFLGKHKDAGRPVCFLVGGAHGFDSAGLGGTKRLSLSPMTMAHELALVVLCEQIYRAWAHRTGRPYAK